MTGPFSLRRTAEEFNAALSRTPDRSTEPLTEQDARQFAELLAVVRDLRSIPEPAPRPEFVADLRSRLMTEAETALLPLPRAARPLTAQSEHVALPVRAHSRDRRLAALLGGAALIGATTSMAVAAQTALPGESLYAVKRGIEDARSGIARDDAAKGHALLASARGRLDEIGELADRSDPASVSAVRTTLETFDAQAGEASEMLIGAYEETGDESVIVELRSFTGTSIDVLAGLEPTIPSSSRDALVAAGQRLAQIDHLAGQLCPTCGGGPATIPANLLPDAGALLDVETVIVSASQDPDLLDRAAPKVPELQSPATPDTISGQDVKDVQVPDLTVPVEDPSAPAATATPTGKNPELPTVDTEVDQSVNEVTKLLTGDLEDETSGLPVTNEVVTGVGTTVDGALVELEGTLPGQLQDQLPGQVPGQLQGQLPGPLNDDVKGATGSLLP